MVSSDNLSASNKKDLYNCIRIIRSHRNDILILTIRICDFLLLCDLLHTRQKFPVLNGLFKFHCFRCILHLCFKFPDYRRIVSVKELQCFAHLPAVGFFIDVSLTGRITLVNMIIETGTIQSDISWKFPVAGTKFINLIDQLNRVFDSTCTRVWSKISGLVFFELARKQYTWKIFSHRHPNIRIRLIITKHRIILWCMLFDQITFEHERLQLRISNDILKAGNVLYHLFFLDSLIMTRLKILPYTFSQADCFSDINNCIRTVVHNIDPRLIREFF